MHKQQLAFYCMMLSSLQGYFPDSAFIINKKFEKIKVPIDKKVLSKTQNDIDEIVEILRGKKPPGSHFMFR